MPWSTACASRNFSTPSEFGVVCREYQKIGAMSASTRIAASHIGPHRRDTDIDSPACNSGLLPPFSKPVKGMLHVDAILGNGSGPAAADLIKNGSTATFMADVIDASKDQAVIVDFWAPWCGPCKQLGPALEKAVKDARGAVKLVKINVDENQELAPQMRIQSIPAVYAFKDGRPVDGFVGALPESQIKQFVGKLAGGAAGPIADRRSAGARQGSDRRRRPGAGRRHLHSGSGARAGQCRRDRRPDAQRHRAQGSGSGEGASRRPAARASRAMPRFRRRAPRSSWPRPAQKAQGATGELEARLKADPQGSSGAARSRRGACSPRASASGRSTSCSIWCAARANGTSRRRASSSSNSSRRWATPIR